MAIFAYGGQQVNQLEFTRHKVKEIKTLLAHGSTACSHPGRISASKSCIHRRILPIDRKIVLRMVREYRIVGNEGGHYDLKINDRRAFEDPAREERRKEKARILQEVFTEYYPELADGLDGKWDDITEETFFAIDKIYGPNEVTADARSP